MINLVGRTLQLVFGPPAADRSAPPSLPEPDPSTELEFSAYTEDFRLFGHIRLAGERLTDMVNTLTELILIEVMVENLSDGTASAVAELRVARDELLAVEVGGPRGNPARRIRVQSYPIGVQLGPYQVRGYVHVSPGTDPLAALRRKRPLVPLTEATIEYELAGTRIQRRSPTILFNRELADWITLVGDGAIDSPDVPIVRDASPRSVAVVDQPRRALESPRIKQRPATKRT